MGKTSIPYVSRVWNPVQGCSPASEGCAHCWAERLAKRFRWPWGGPVLHEERLNEPASWKQPQRVFVCSMSDLFHEDVPFEFAARVFHRMIINAPQHTYLVLTKRADRLHEFLTEYIDSGPALLPECDNIWLGVTVENQARAEERLPLLLKTPAAHRWVSVEPLLGPVDLAPFLGNISDLPDMAGDWCPPPRHGKWYQINEMPDLDWIVVGGESGPGARPMHPAWAHTLRDQCAAAGVPYYFKQWGSLLPFKEDCEEYPSDNRPLEEHRDENGRAELFTRLGAHKAGALLGGLSYTFLPEGWE